MKDLPGADSIISERVVGLVRSAGEQLDLADDVFQDPGALHRIDRRVERVGDVVDIAKLPSGVTMLPIPGDRKPSRRVEVALAQIKSGSRRIQVCDWGARGVPRAWGGYLFGDWAQPTDVMAEVKDAFAPRRRRLPFFSQGAYGGAPIEGYFWRFTQERSPQVVIALVGVINGERSLCAMAWHPGGSRQQAIVEAAEADSSRFGVRAGGALAGDDSSLLVNLAGEKSVHFNVNFSEQVRYPAGRMGALGLGLLVPNLAHYWQPILLGGRADGELRSAGEALRLDNARVYAERTWGTAFPALWWWGQADRFESADACLAFAGGPLSVAGLKIAPTALVLRIEDRLLAFAPPLATTRAQVAPGAWRLQARSPRFRLEVEGHDPDETTTLLPVPIRDGKQTELRAAQTLAGLVRVTLSRGPRILFRGESSLAGLEQATA